MQTKLRERLNVVAMAVLDSPRSMASKMAILSSADTGGRNAGSLSSRRSRTTVLSETRNVRSMASGRWPSFERANDRRFGFGVEVYAALHF